jgi:hypothetical protein
VLDTIDTKLLPAAKNPELKTLIQALRPRIQQHLDQAKQLQTTLGSK